MRHPVLQPNPADPAARPAFTLIELLVVISIIALLVGILLPVLSSARAAGKQVACLSNQKQIGTGFSSYFVDHGGTIPYAAITRDLPTPPQFLSWDDFLQGYVVRSRDPQERDAAGVPLELGEPVLICPADPARAELPDTPVRSYSMPKGNPHTIWKTTDGDLAYGTGNQVFNDSPATPQITTRWLRAKAKDVPSPSDTFLLVGNPARPTNPNAPTVGRNLQGGVNEAAVSNVNDITPRKTGGSGTYVTHGTFDAPIYSFLKMDGSASSEELKSTIGDRQGASAANPSTGWTRTSAD